MASDLVQRRRWSFVRFLRAASQSDFENVFATLVRQRADALLVSADPFFLSHRDQLVAQAMRQSMPAIYYAREFAAAGGLISYASSFADSFRRRFPVMARSCRAGGADQCPKLGVERTQSAHAATAESDRCCRKRDFAGVSEQH
jgi:hypothetical protein